MEEKWEDKKISVADQFYQEIKEQIVTLKLMPGQLLLVQQLALEYGISRTPVREALVRLKEEGLVNEADGRKFRVSYISWKLIEDNYQARQIVEEAAILYASEHAGKEDVKKLREIWQQMEVAYREQQFGAYFDLDLRFHWTIVQIMKNDVLSGWMEKSADQQQRIRYCTMGISASMQESLEEHRKMVECIERQDREGAGQVMKTHLERALEDMMKLKNQIFPIPLTLIQ